MYRLFSDNNIPLLSCDDVYQRYAKNNVETLHEKNLFHLGEDRMLTTLLLRAFPGMKLSFVPEAVRLYYFDCVCPKNTSETSHPV